MKRTRPWIAVIAAWIAVSAAACSHPAKATAPAALQGTWRAHSGPNTLEFDGSRWTLTTGDRVFSGKFVAAGDELVLLLTFANHPAYQSFCRTDLDVYTWSVTGPSLTLRTVGTTAASRATDRPCNTIADQVFRNGPWTRTD
jgi:hypothetical protein